MNLPTVMASSAARPTMPPAVLPGMGSIAGLYKASAVGFIGLHPYRNVVEDFSHTLRHLLEPLMHQMTSSDCVTTEFVDEDAAHRHNLAAAEARVLEAAMHNATIAHLAACLINLDACSDSFDSPRPIVTCTFIHARSLIIVTIDAMMAAQGVLMDQYGVLHDGKKPHPSAIQTISRMASGDQRVLILSNSSRSKKSPYVLPDPSTLLCLTCPSFKTELNDIDVPRCEDRKRFISWSCMPLPHLFPPFRIGRGTREALKDGF